MYDTVAMWSQGFISINSSHYGRFHKISRSPISLLHPTPPHPLPPALSFLSSSPPPHSQCLLRLMDHSIIDEAAVRGEGTRLLQCDEFSPLLNYISNQARLAPWPQTGDQPPRKSQRKYWLRFYVFIYLLIHFALHCRSTVAVFLPLRID